MEYSHLVVIVTAFICYILFKKLFYNKNVYIVDVKIITKYKDSFCDELVLSSEYFSQKEFAHEWANVVIDNKSQFDKWLNDIIIYDHKPTFLHSKLYEAKEPLKKRDKKFVADSVNISYTVTHKVMRK